MVRTPEQRHAGRPCGSSGAVKVGFGSLPLCRHAPALAVFGDAEDLAEGRWLLGFGRAETEVVQDAVEGEGVGEEGDDAHALAGTGASVAVIGEPKQLLDGLGPRAGQLP
jgi:hypothetical protein